MTRTSNKILFVLVLMLATADWLSVPTTAQDGSNRLPDRVPADAMLTGNTVRSATFEGLEIELHAADDGFVLALYNPNSQPLTAHFEVDCVQRTGSPISRIGPIPRVVHTQTVEITLAAGERVRHMLSADVHAAPEPDENQATNMFASVTSTSFQLRKPGEPSTVAELRWPAATEEG